MNTITKVLKTAPSTTKVAQVLKTAATRKQALLDADQALDGLTKRAKKRNQA